MLNALYSRVNENNLDMAEVKQETKVFQCIGIQDDIRRMVNEINAYLKDQEGAEISYHNIQGKDYTLVIATVTLLRTV